MAWLTRGNHGAGGDRGGRKPPPPDTTVPFGSDMEREIEAIYSPTKKYRAVVTRDQAGLFRVHAQRWDNEDWDVGGSPHWCPYTRGVTITDTLENARMLARDKLALVEPPKPEEEDVEQ